MDYIFGRSSRLKQNDELKLIHQIRNAFLSLAKYKDFISYAQERTLCLNCLKIVATSMRHKCINYQQLYLIDVLNAIVSHIDTICICYWCQKTYNEIDIISHLMRCPLNIFKSNSSYSRILPETLNSFIDCLRSLSIHNVSFKLDYEFFVYILDQIVFDYYKENKENLDVNLFWSYKPWSN